MQHLHALHTWISHMSPAASNATPLHVLCAVGAIGLLVCLLARTREWSVLALSALLYSLPIVLPLCGKLVR